jgi:hydroxymethylglutaryl-CoA reductase (NADPH)
MVSVPSFLLRRLYVKGSLKNDAGGFEFQLKNGLGSGYAHKMSPLRLDGAELEAGSTFFYLDGRETAFADVSEKKTFKLAMNKTITIWIDGVALEPGAHKLEMGFDVPGLGTLRFDFTDVVADE